MGSTAQHTALKRRLAEALIAQGWQVQSNPAGPFTGRGHSDLTACCQGRYVALEVKTGKGQLTAAQRVYLQKIRRAKGLALVAREVKSTILAIRTWLSDTGSFPVSDDFELDLGSLFDDDEEEVQQPNPAPSTPPEPASVLKEAESILLPTAAGPSAAPVQGKTPASPEEKLDYVIFLMQKILVSVGKLEALLGAAPADANEESDTPAGDLGGLFEETPKPEATRRTRTRRS